jgi:hypothetical protein
MISSSAQFVRAAAEQYGFQDKGIIAVGYSNRANIASSLMLLHPHLLSGAVLFRPMIPFAMDLAPIFDAFMSCLQSETGRSTSYDRQVTGTEFVPAIAPINQHIRAGSLEHGGKSVKLFPRDNQVTIEVRARHPEHKRYRPYVTLSRR